MYIRILHYVLYYTQDRYMNAQLETSKLFFSKRISDIILLNAIFVIQKVEMS